MKLFEMEGFLHGKCIPCDMKINETNAEYLVRKFAEAEAKCAALAAENSQMLRLLTDISDNHEEYVNQDEYLYAGVPMDYVSEINSYVSRDVEAENPFKETDSFLAEVRASAVDSLIDIKTNQLARMHPDTHAFGATADFIRSQINELQSFAALLRKGVQS